MWANSAFVLRHSSERSLLCLRLYCGCFGRFIFSPEVFYYLYVYVHHWNISRWKRIINWMPLHFFWDETGFFCVVAFYSYTVIFSCNIWMQFYENFNDQKKTCSLKELVIDVIYKSNYWFFFSFRNEEIFGLPVYL